MMFSLSFVGGSKSVADLDRGGPYPLADLDQGIQIRWDTVAIVEESWTSTWGRVVQKEQHKQYFS